MGNNRTDYERLAELNITYIDALRHSDAGWFDDQVGEDFISSNPDGTLFAKRAFLAHVAKPFPVTEYQAEEIKIRPFADFAIIHARTRFKNEDGKVRRGRTTHVWVKRDGRWIVAAAHETR